MNTTRHISFVEYAKQGLVLMQPSLWRREYHLRAGETVVMTMRYPKWYSSEAIIEAEGKTWQMRKTSFWRTALEIKRQENQLPFATFEPEGWKGGGFFKLPNGARLEYRFSPWKNLNELFDHRNQRVAELRSESLWKRSLAVTIDHPSELLDEHPWIIMAVYHLILQRRQRAHAAV